MKKICRIIYFHFEIHWKLILIFFIFWITLIAILFGLSFINEFFVIAAGEARKISEYNGQRSGGSIEVMAIDKLYTFVFNGFGIVFYLFVITVFLNKIILREVTSNQISLWLTQPISKNKVILAKYFFLLIVISTLYLPSYLVMLSVSTQAFDKKTSYTDLALGGLQIYIYLLFFGTIFFVLALLFAEKGTTVNIIFSGIISYMILVALLEIFILLSRSQNDFVLLFANYLGPQILLTQIFNYDFNVETETITLPGGTENLYYEFTPIKVLPVNYVKFWILFTLMGVSTVGLTFLNCLIFRNKSLNI